MNLDTEALRKMVSDSEEALAGETSDGFKEFFEEKMKEAMAKRSDTIKRQKAAMDKKVVKRRLKNKQQRASRKKNRK